MKKEYICKTKSLLNKQVITRLNQNIFENLVGSKLPDEVENIRTANKLGMLIVIFLLFQFFVVLALVLKAFEIY